MKMDVETFEANVLKGAYKFFDQVKIELLLMEFVAHKNKESGKFIADFLLSHGMEPNVPEHVKNDYKKCVSLGQKSLFDVHLFSENVIIFPIACSLVIISSSSDFFVGATVEGGVSIMTAGRFLLLTNKTNKWTSNKDFCPSDTSKFVYTKLASPFNIPIYVYTTTEDQWVSGRIISGGIWPATAKEKTPMLDPMSTNVAPGWLSIWVKILLTKSSSQMPPLIILPETH
jgi:hypothetical protein